MLKNSMLLLILVSQLKTLLMKTAFFMHKKLYLNLVCSA